MVPQFMQDFSISGQIKAIHQIIHRTWGFIIKAQKELMKFFFYFKGR